MTLFLWLMIGAGWLLGSLAILTSCWPRCFYPGQGTEQPRHHGKRSRVLLVATAVPYTIAGLVEVLSGEYRGKGLVALAVAVLLGWYGWRSFTRHEQMHQVWESHARSHGRVR